MGQGTENSILGDSKPRTVLGHSHSGAWVWATFTWAQGGPATLPTMGAYSVSWWPQPPEASSSEIYTWLCLPPAGWHSPRALVPPLQTLASREVVESARRTLQGVWMRGRFCGPWSGVQSRPCGLHTTEGSGEQGRRNRSLKSYGLVYDPDEHLRDFLRLCLTSRQRSQHLVKTVL